MNLVYMVWKAEIPLASSGKSISKLSQTLSAFCSTSDQRQRASSALDWHIACVVCAC